MLHHQTSEQPLIAETLCSVLSRLVCVPGECAVYLGDELREVLGDDSEGFAVHGKVIVLFQRSV